VSEQEDQLCTAGSGGEAAKEKRRRRRSSRRRRRRLRRRIPPLSVMPTLVTLGNLVAGFTAIHYASKPLDASGPWGWSGLTVAGLLVFIGMFLDAVDGSIARITRTHSDIGAQIDSLADLVTFGVAPAFMMLRLVSHYLDPESATTILGPDADNAFAKVLWGVAAVYVCCTTLRLARFNVETPSAAVEHHLVFRGLPSPGAAGAVASLIVLHQHWLYTRTASPDDVSLSFARWSAFGIPLLTFLCAVAMVSSLPYVHFMNRYVRGRRSFTYVARLVIPLCLALWWFPQETLAAAFTFYVVSSPLRMTISRIRRRLSRRGAPPKAEAE
jgi:CDP-diacylglycerol--serine O-phosphatidyltransferase